MTKREQWVRVPASTGSKLKRPIKVTIEANSGAEATAKLRGKYGTSNVIGAAATKVMPGYKPRPKPSRLSSTANRSINYNKSRKNFKNFSTSKSGDNAGGGGGLAIFLIILILFWLFNKISNQLLISIFSRGKVGYWYKHNKHAIAFSLASMNIMMFLLVIGFVFNYLII